MTVKEKIDELEVLYAQIQNIIDVFGARIETLSYDKLCKVNEDVDELKSQIEKLENEIFVKNPNYIGEVSARYH